MPSTAHFTPFRAALAGSGLLLFLGVLDYVTGFEIGFFVFYFAPVLLLAWYTPYWSAVTMSFASAIVWMTVDLVSQHPYSHPAIPYWNTFIRLISFLVIAHFASRARTLLLEEQELTERLRETLVAIKQLKGLLPICASCKRIRNDRGYWQQIESYVRDHSEAEFSHGLCPECVRKLYPSVADRVLADKPTNAETGGEGSDMPGRS